MVPAIVELALDYYRNPIAHSHVADISRPLPCGFSELLTEFGAALSSSHIEQTAKLLSVDVQELEQASQFFARHVLLDPAGDYYRHLGLSRDATPEAIRNHYLLLIRMFHPDRIRDANGAVLACSSRVNAAYAVLRDPAKRTRYDQGLPKAAWKESCTDLSTFFQSRPQVAFTPELERPKYSRYAFFRWRFAALFMGIALLGTWYLLTRPSPQPVLRLTGHDIVGESNPMPRYLTGAGEARTPAVPNSAERRATVATEVHGDGSIGQSEVNAPDLDRRTSTTAPRFSRDDTAKKSPAASTGEKLDPLNQSVVPWPITPPTISRPPISPRRSMQTEPTGPSLPEALELNKTAPHLEPVRKFALERGDETRERRIPTLPTPALPKTPALPAELPMAAPRIASPSSQEKTGPSKASAASSSTPSSTAMEAPRMAGTRLVSRLVRAYRQGNADAIAALFTKSARTSDGTGRALIRSQYARLFGDVTDQRLVMTRLSWQPVASMGLRGSGRFSVNTRDRASGRLRRSKGEIEIELVPVGRDYRISKMLYRLD
ncbi:MAG: DnaJ domain-containing protein [Thiohalocapsa sp.]